MTDTLRCKCGGTVRIVRLGESTLALGHEQNPRNHSHPVRLARTTAERPSEGLEDSRRSSEGPVSDGVTTTARGLSPDPALLRKPRGALRVRAGSLPTPSGARVVVGPPSTPRVPLAAGRPT